MKVPQRLLGLVRIFEKGHLNTREHFNTVVQKSIKRWLASFESLWRFNPHAGLAGGRLDPLTDVRLADAVRDPCVTRLTSTPAR